MVVAKQVEDAVDGEQRQLVGELDATLTSASRRDRQRDHDLAQLSRTVGSDQPREVGV